MKSTITCVIATLLIGVFITTTSTSEIPDWRDEHWSVSEFAAALGGGPTTGPLAGTGTFIDALCQDKQGNFFLIHGQRIDIVTPDGIRHHLAGDEEFGNRDGAAHMARFQMGVRAYYGARNITCGDALEAFVSDSGNLSIRRIYKEDGVWQVSTWAGGGTRALTKGEAAPPSQVRLDGRLAVARNSMGELIIATKRGAYRVNIDGTKMTYLGPWPQSSAHKAGRPPQLNIVDAAADLHGNSYFVSKHPGIIIKVDATGDATQIAGLTMRPRQGLNIGDGPPLEIFLFAPHHIVAAPDGRAVYVTGGDEYNIRRIPTTPGEHTATLMNNGRWGHSELHPNKARGPAIYQPEAQGTLKPEGDLSILLVSELIGRDNQGNLYGHMFRWSGLTQRIKDKGLLGTRIYKISRMKQ